MQYGDKPGEWPLIEALWQTFLNGGFPAVNPKDVDSIENCGRGNAFTFDMPSWGKYRVQITKVTEGR